MIENKEDIIYNLRQVERLLQKNIFLVEEQKQLDEIESTLYRLKKQVVNLIFDIDETK